MAAGEAFNGGIENPGARERLNSDFKALKQDANAVLSDLAEVTGRGVSSVRERARETASRARLRSEDFIQDHPWRTVAMVAGIGIVAGFLLRRR